MGVGTATNLSRSSRACRDLAQAEAFQFHTSSIRQVPCYYCMCANVPMCNYTPPPPKPLQSGCHGCAARRLSWLGCANIGGPVANCYIQLTIGSRREGHGDWRQPTSRYTGTTDFTLVVAILRPDASQKKLVADAGQVHDVEKKRNNDLHD